MTKSKGEVEFLAKLENLKLYWESQGMAKALNPEFVRGNIQAITNAIELFNGADVWGSVESDRVP